MGSWWCATREPVPGGVSHDRQRGRRRRRGAGRFFARAISKLEGFESRANFGTWIYRIAVRCALDKIEAARGRMASRVAEETDPEAQDVQVADRGGRAGAAVAERARLARCRQAAMQA